MDAVSMASTMSSSCKKAPMAWPIASRRADSFSPVSSPGLHGGTPLERAWGTRRGGWRERARARARGRKRGGQRLHMHGLQCSYSVSLPKDKANEFRVSVSAVCLNATVHIIRQPHNRHDLTLQSLDRPDLKRQSYIKWGSKLLYHKIWIRDEFCLVLLVPPAPNALGEKVISNPCCAILIDNVVIYWPGWQHGPQHRT